MMTDVKREQVVQELRDHVDTLDLQNGDHVDLSRELTIICGDDGKQIAYRGTCPKCGGAAWVPAGSVTLKHLKDLGEDTLNEIRRALGAEVKGDVPIEDG